jgi:hypothetical protein
MIIKTLGDLRRWVAEQPPENDKLPITIGGYEGEDLDIGLQEYVLGSRVGTKPARWVQIDPTGKPPPWSSAFDNYGAQPRHPHIHPDERFR